MLNLLVFFSLFQPQDDTLSPILEGDDPLPNSHKVVDDGVQEWCIRSISRLEEFKVSHFSGKFQQIPRNGFFVLQSKIDGNTALNRQATEAKTRFLP